MEMYKISQGLSRPIMQNVFNFKSESHYTLRQIFQSFKVYVSRNWNCFTFGLKIWDIKTDKNRSINNPETLKIKIKKSNWENYPSRLCQAFMYNLGFL